MVVRNIKFPLKMQNGAEVRSLEELRENADVESIMKYYSNGKLKKWCKAFGMNEIAEEIPEINKGYVRKILNMLGVEITEEKIEEYISKNFGNNSDDSVLQITADIEEEPVKETKGIKEELQQLLIEEQSINLSDYVIEVLPVWNDKGKIEKNRVIITNEKTEQYSRFSFLNEEREDYNEELYKKDLNEKIAYAIKEMKKSQTVYEKRSSITSTKYSSLKKGEVFEFGKYDGKILKWRVLDTGSDSIYVLCETKICDKQFEDSGRRSNDWSQSPIRKWLNEEFYKGSFDNEEKECIKEVNSDKVTLLSKEEAEKLMTQQERSLGSIWWLRSAYPIFSYYAWSVYSDGSLNNLDVKYTLGVRPALNLKL